MIVGHDGLQSQGCTVRDLSARGARIALPQGAIVPPGLYLLTSRQPVGYKARIIWRNATQAGVRFLGEHQLSATMPGELLFLWQLYLELRPRATNPFDF